jgi:hypothetical protein
MLQEGVFHIIPSLKRLTLTWKWVTLMDQLLLLSH